MLQAFIFLGTDGLSARALMGLHGGGSIRNSISRLTNLEGPKTFRVYRCASLSVRVDDRNPMASITLRLDGNTARRTVNLGEVLVLIAPRSLVEIRATLRRVTCSGRKALIIAPSLNGIREPFTVLGAIIHAAYFCNGLGAKCASTA